MKTLSRFLRLKTLVVIVLFALCTTSFSVYNTSPAYSDCRECVCGVTNQQCINYLLALGYHNVSVISLNGCNRYCDSDYSYNTTVFCSNGIITGWEDDPH